MNRAIEPCAEAYNLANLKLLARIMRSTGIFEAKRNFSALIDAVEAGEEVVITRHGKPAVRLLPVAPKSTVSQRQIEQDIAELGRLRARVKPGPGWRELRDEGRKY